MSDTKLAFFAENIERTIATNPELADKIRRGLSSWRTMGRAVEKTERTALRGARAVLAPGKHPGAVDALGEAYNIAGTLPATALATAAVGLPVVRHEHLKNLDLTSNFVNKALEEGRQVYANAQEFLTQKIAEAKALQPTEKNANFFLDLANGIGATLNGPGKSHFGNAMSYMSGTAPSVGGAMGAMLPGLGAAAGAIGDIAKPITTTPAGTFGYQLNRRLNPLTDRVQADETFAKSFLTQSGKEVATTMVSLLKDMTSKAMTNITNGGAVDAMLKALMKNDSILAKADPVLLSKAYHSMSSFAPTLARDENAVRSFLREAVMAGTGPDYATIANLAKAEAAITGKGK